MRIWRITLALVVVGALLGAMTFLSATQQPAVVQAQDDGWETDWSKKLGVSLLAEFDSSGPPAWDPGGSGPR